MTEPITDVANILGSNLLNSTCNTDTSNTDNSVNIISASLSEIKINEPARANFKSAKHAELELILSNYCDDKYSNGIMQHTTEWLAAKKYTVGGSTVPILMGINPYSSKQKLLLEKLGLEQFKSGIQPQWGNLFEDVIKRHFEYTNDCIVYGEDLYILGADACTSYSPDGLAVIDVTDYKIIEEEVKDDFGTHINYTAHEVITPQIVLLEFKCPYSRIPSGSIPEYYVPQVLMGLDLMNMPTSGLFIEGVFRRCSLDQLDLTPKCDRTLVKVLPTFMTNALCYGIIGFSICNKDLPSLAVLKDLSFMTNYLAQYGGYGSVDLGIATVELFTIIMSAYDKKIFTPYYGPNRITGDCLDDISNHEQYCIDNGRINIGVLPYKLMRTYTNKVDKIDGYLDKWLPEIGRMINIVKQCDGKEPQMQRDIIGKYCGQAG